MYIKSDLTRFGDNLGFAWRSSAAAPATAGVAIEVPERYICFLSCEPDVLAESDGSFVTSRLL